MKRIFAKVLLGLFLSVAVFGAAVSPVSAACDNGVPDGGEARNAGNGCIYRCSGSSWSGPLRCDGQGNGQFQGPPAKSAEEKQAQARAVQQAQQDAERVVAQQGAAATAAQAASTAEQRAKEATRQQAMVEAQRQAEVDLATRLGASAADIAKIEADARTAAAFVAQAQGTTRGQTIVGSGAANAAAIAEAGYDPTGALATGNVTVSGGAITAGVTRVSSAGGGTGGGGGVNLGSDAANAAMYTGADKCDINGGGDNVAPGGVCCRGGKVECANSGICSAGSVGQTGKCSTSGLAAGDPEARAVAFRNANGTVSNIPILAAGSSCSGNTRSCAYAGGVACVSSTTYSDANGGCATWQRDVQSQANRGSSEAIVASSNSCTGTTRGCLYGGGWVCVDRTRYPEGNSGGTDTSNGCAAWHRDFTGTSLVGGSVKFKVSNGSCVSCVAGDSASVCAYSTLAQCNSAVAIARASSGDTANAVVRYRLDGGTCVACRTQQDAAQYNCQYTESTCGNRGGANSNAQPGRACSNGPCYCPSTGAQIQNGAICPTEFQADRTANCPANSERIVSSSGPNRTACLQAGTLKYQCNSGTSANNCDPSAGTASLGFQQCSGSYVRRGTPFSTPCKLSNDNDTYSMCTGNYEREGTLCVPKNRNATGTNATSSIQNGVNDTLTSQCQQAACNYPGCTPSTDTQRSTYASCMGSASSDELRNSCGRQLNCPSTGCAGLSEADVRRFTTCLETGRAPAPVVATNPVSPTQQSADAFCRQASSAADASVPGSNGMVCCGDVAIPSTGSCLRPLEESAEVTPIVAPTPRNLCNSAHGQETGERGDRRYCCDGAYSATACAEPINAAVSQANGQFTDMSDLPYRTYCGTTTNPNMCPRCRDGATTQPDSQGRLYCRYTPSSETVQLDAETTPVACTPEGQSPSGESRCCANMTTIAEISNGQTRNVCRSYNALTTINQDTSAGTDICSDPDGCLCRQQGGNGQPYRVQNHVAQGVACPNYSANAGVTLSECSGTTVAYGTAFSDACKVGFGMRATCKSGFREDNGSCVSSSIGASALTYICRINSSLPQCPNNPNGQYLTVGQRCASSAQCFCSGGYMSGNVCTAYTQLSLGGECPGDVSQCTCSAGKFVGNKCVPKNEQNFCMTMTSSESCVDGYRYRCNPNVGPVGQQTWTGETCGSRICTPGAVQCQGDSAFKICRGDGTGWLENNACAAHTVCVQSAGRCVDNRPLEILGNECRLLGEREYAVNLPQCNSGSYVCEHGVSRMINGAYVCPSPNGSYSHGCPENMYYELAAGECRNNPDAATGQESFAGYQCTDSTINDNGVVRRLCHECGRQGQPACTNCYGQNQSGSSFCATNLAEVGRATGGYVIVPVGQTAQEYVNDVFGYVCNKVGEPNCRPCGGQGQQACPIQNSQDATVELVIDCAQVRQRFPTNASESCRAGNDGIVTGEATPVREGVTCSRMSSVVSSTTTVTCSLCGHYPEEACPAGQDYFNTRELRQACDSFRQANPIGNFSCTAG